MVVESVSKCIQYRKLSKRKFEYSIKNCTIRRNRKEYTDKAAQQRAMYLADKFRNPDGMDFYLKVAWNLNDSYIDWLVTYSLKKKDPSRYFVSVANKKMLEIV